MASETDIGTDADLCFVADAHDGYRDFALIYAISALVSYPESHVRMWLKGKPPTPRVAQALAAAEKRHADRLRVSYDWLRKSRTHRWFRTHMWWLPEADIREHRYAYFYDIDFVMLPEGPVVEEQVRGMRRLGLPFHNCLRWPEYLRRRRTKGDRMTGLHFVETAPYYDVMRPVLAEADRVRLCKDDNERVLYLLTHEGFGGTWDDKLLRDAAHHRHYGIHLSKTRTPHKGGTAARLDRTRSELTRNGRLQAFHRLLDNQEVLEACRALRHMAQIRRLLAMAQKEFGDVGA